METTLSDNNALLKILQVPLLVLQSQYFEGNFFVLVLSFVDSG